MKDGHVRHPWAEHRDGGRPRGPGRVGFGVAAFVQQQLVVQQQVVAATAAGGDTQRTGTVRLSVDSFRSLAHQRRWLAGWVLFGAASLVHLSALVLAPVSVVQPVGVLAVPVAVLLGAPAAGWRPSARVVLGVAASVGGTGTFVVLSSTGQSATSTSPTWTGLLTAALVVGGVVVGLSAVSRHRSRVTRCLASAATGAICFGFSSTLIRVVARGVHTDGLSALVIVVGLVTVCALAVGAWAVQQAYASGPAAVVVGSLTVGDPLVAILLSAGLLGEGGDQSLGVVSLMIGCAVAAAAGVGLLAQHYPPAGTGPGRGAERSPAATPRSPDFDRPQQLVSGKART